MNLMLGRKIGEGGCAEVFEWGNSDKIIKLAKVNTDFEGVKREFQNNLIAWDNGLPVAQPYELLEINGRPGIVFERIYGETIMERFTKQVLNQTSGSADINDEDICVTARVLSEIHKKSDVSLPSSQRDYLKNSIHRVGYLTLAEKEAVISILDTLPSKQLLCHGDPNPGNILIKDDGNAVVIDWMDASIGNPEADIAEYIIMIRYAILPPYLPGRVAEYFDSIREAIIDIFMNEYTKLTGVAYGEVYPWIIPVAARKLSAGAISENEKKLLVSEIRKTLNK